MEQRQSVVAGALVRGRRILLGERGSGKEDAGKWELPGGKVEAGESDAQALRRELLEELSLQVSVGAFVGSAELGERYLLKAYLVHSLEGPVALEHATLGWFEEAELAALPWCSHDEPLARKALEMACSPH